MAEERRWDVAACLAGIARQDQKAARELVEHCWPLVLKLVRAHRSRFLSEQDLAQEVFLKLFSRLDRYELRDGIPFEHWVSRLAVRTCLDALRVDRRRPKEALPPLSESANEWLDTLRRDDAAPPIDDVLAARELVEALLSRLEPRDRLVLTLLDMEEHSVAEVSAVTGWSQTLVKVRAFRARRRLRALIERRQ
jgi:RNA polymerase sigma-70 factor (ECF subfamily)